MSQQDGEAFEESGIFQESLSKWRGVSCNPDGSFCYEDEEFDPIPLDLHTSASIGETELVRDILKRKQVKINKLNRGGWSALMYASYMGHRDTIQLLLETGADANQVTPHGSTALILAAMCGYDSVMSYLLQNGADLEAKDHRGWTALFHAASSGHQQTTEFLIKASADLEVMEPTHHLTPVMEAAASGHEFIVEQLLQQGVDISRVDINGDNAYTLASDYGHIEVAQLIENFKGTKQISKRIKSKRKPRDHMSCLQPASSYGSSGPSILDAPKAFAQITGLGADGKPKPNTALPLYLQEQPPQPSTHQKFESTWKGPKDLSTLLNEIGCSKHLLVFKEQDIDLRIFLTLTEAELKEIGIKLFGPRRKMVATISRINSSIQVGLIDKVELAYCDSLLMKTKDLNEKLKESQDRVVELSAQLAQERQLRSVAESVLMEQKEIRSAVQGYTDKIITEHGNLIAIADTIRSHYAKSSQSKSWQQSNHTVPSTSNRTIEQEFPKLSQEFDSVLHHSRDCLLEMRRLLQSVRPTSAGPGKGDVQWKERG